MSGFHVGRLAVASQVRTQYNRTLALLSCSIGIMSHERETVVSLTKRVCTYFTDACLRVSDVVVVLCLHGNVSRIFLAAEAVKTFEKTSTVSDWQWVVVTSVKTRRELKI